MRHVYNIFIMIKLVIFVIPVYGISQDYSLLKVEGLSDRVLTVSAKTGNYRITAVKSERGLIVIDSQWSRSIAAESRALISYAFQRDDFRYLINTSMDLLLTGGNGEYEDAVIIAHH